MHHSHLVSGLLIGVAAGVGVYVLNKLDWFHDDAKDYQAFESNHA